MDLPDIKEIRENMANKRVMHDEERNVDGATSKVDLSESSVWGKDDDESVNESAEELAADAAMDRAKSLRRGADEEAVLFEGRTGEEEDALDASTEEEIDALKVNLMQDDAPANARDGSGRVVDDVAEEQIAEFTEVGADLSDEGVLQVTPGRDDTSEVLRRHHPNTEVGRADAVVEGNVEDVRSERLDERHVDEGTAG